MRKIGVVAVPVFHAAYGAGQEPLWLVASRPGKGREPWYLLTNEPVENAQAAWRVVQAYARRWQIEMSLRFNKSELALESPRLWSWERRLKLLMLVTLAYAFLLVLLRLLRLWLRRAAPVVSPHRKAEPGNPGSALPIASGALAPLCRSSSTLIH